MSSGRRRGRHGLLGRGLVVHPALLFSIALGGSLPGLGAQETGAITGWVVHAEGGAPIPGMHVRLRDSHLGAVSTGSGRFVFRGVPPGAHVLLFSNIGYEDREVPVVVEAGATAEVTVALGAVPIELAELIVDAASRTPQRFVDAPAAVSVVDRAVMNDLSITAQAPRALAALPGVDVVQSGVFDYNVNTRGFNSSLTRRMLVLQDGRDLAVPLLGFQEWSALSRPLGDFRSVEVVRGPGSALYGANAYSGVIDIRSYEPREVPGFKGSVGGGELSTLRGDIRWAGLSTDGRLGFKVNAGHSRSDTWSRARTDFDGGALRREYREATDAPVGDVREAVPLFGQTVDPANGTPVGEPDPVTTTYGSARIDLYRDDGSVGTLEGGASRIENTLWVTGLGRVQIDEALRPWARLAWRHERWNAFASYSGRTSLDSPHRALSSGAPLVDRSHVVHVEGQARSAPDSRGLELVAGGSFRATWTDTEETLFAAPDDDRSDLYYSAYGQVQGPLGGRLHGMAALRIDDGNLFDPQWSPRVGLTFEAGASHTFRVTASRAFQTPTQIERFLRLPAGLPADFSALEAGLRASPLGPALQDVPEGELFTNSSSVPVLALGNPDLEVESVRSLEVGYKGRLSDRLFVTVDAYYSLLGDFVTDLLPGANPTYGPWTAPEAVPEDSREPLEEAVRSQLVAAGRPLAAAGLTRLQDGATAIVVSYGNAGEATEHGLELGVSGSVTPELTFGVNYTYFGFDVDEGSTLAGDELLPNTPHHKGNLSVQYLGGEGLDLGLTARFVEAFDWSAGVFSGRVPSSQTVDLRAGYRIGSHLRIHAVATDVFDQRRFHLYGGSVIGRRVVGAITIAY